MIIIVMVNVIVVVNVVIMIVIVTVNVIVVVAVNVIAIAVEVDGVVRCTVYVICFLGRRMRRATIVRSRIRRKHTFCRSRV